MKRIDLFNHKLYLGTYFDNFNEGELIEGFWNAFGKGYSVSNWDIGACIYNWKDVSARGICNHFKG